MMISEDFGRFLQSIPGAFVFIGNGAGTTEGTAANATSTPSTITPVRTGCDRTECSTRCTITEPSFTSK